MAKNFKIYKDGGLGYSFEDGASTWEVLPDGVLEVWDAPNKQRLVFSPAGWEHVAEAEAEKPNPSVYKS